MATQGQEYGVGAPVALQPGDKGLLLGTEPVYGFFGSGGSGAPNLSQENPVTLQEGKAARPLIIAAMGGRHPQTQRQLVWRVFPTGSANLNLQVSIDDVDANYITIDSYSGSTASGPRVIVADIQNTGNPPQAQSTGKNLATARFIRVKEGSGSAPATAIADCTCL